MRYLLLVLLYSQINFAQMRLSKEVEELYNAADSLIAHDVNLNNASIKVNEEYAHYITRHYYEAINQDPESLEYSVKLKYNKWVVERVSNPKTIKPGYKLALLKQIITNQYGNDFSNIITTAYFLRVKILQKNITEKKAKDVDVIIKQTNLIALVEDKLKGSCHIKPKDTLDFYYPHTWYNKDLFIEGESYLVPVRLIDCSGNTCKYALKVFNENHFPWIINIQEEKLINNNNKAESWEGFKSDFIQKLNSLIFK